MSVQFGFLVATVLSLLLARPASGQRVGSISGAEPTAEIGRNGVWTPATAGAAVQIGDVLRTGRPGRLSVVFQDDSLVTIGEGSELVVNDQMFAPEQGTVRSVLQLVQGKVRSLVSEYYHGRQAGFEVRTPTALAGVRGTDFVVAHDASAEVTEVVGVSGRVAVNSVLEPDRRGVVVMAHERTVIARGELPQPPEKLSATLFRKYLEGLEFLVGPTGSVPFAQAVVAAQNVPQQDTVAAAGAPAATSAGTPLLAAVPGENPYGVPGKIPIPNPSSVPNVAALTVQPPAVITSSSLGIGF